MQYGLIYRLAFKNIEDNIITVDISPTDVLIPDADTPVITPLVGSGSPFIVSTVNNDESKFQPIRSKQCKIEFISDLSGGLNISTFSVGPDNLWVVTADCNSEIIFRGFLIMADNQQPFLPDPNIVILTATDHLGALKETPWVGYDGSNPVGKMRIADIVCTCLKQTGLERSLFVINNLKAGSAVFSWQSLFSFAGQYIAVSTGVAVPYFYPGQEIIISGTAFNDGTRNVTRVVFSGGVTEVYIEEPIVTGESGVTAIYTDTASINHWFDSIRVDAKTFEAQIGESLSCYEVLERLLGQDSFITQWRGNWWLYRVDEMDNLNSIVTEFSSVGAFISTVTDVIEYSIGAAETTKFANANTLLRFIRPHKYIRETYNYNYPLEIPCNIDFSRGDLFATIDPQTKDYELECWTKRRGLPGAYNTPITITDYIRRIFNTNNYESERYIYITPQTGHVGFSSTDDEYIESEAIPVLVNDKFTMSINWRLTVALTTSSASPRLFRAVLLGNDGSAWILGEATVGDGKPVWYNTTGFTTNTGKGNTGIVFGDVNTLEWNTIDWEAAPVPVSGNLYIWIGQFYQSATTGVNTTVQYDNLRFEYIPYVNGGYSKYTGQYNQVTRPETGYMPNQENEVYISDSPLPIAKGSMFLSNDNLTGTWFDSHLFGGGNPTNVSYLHPFGWLQVYAVMNQFRGIGTTRAHGVNIFQGDTVGLTDYWPDMVHKFFLTDNNPETDNRIFMLISFSQDWKSCQMQGVWVEVFDSAEGKVYTDTHLFKFIAQ